MRVSIIPDRRFCQLLKNRHPCRFLSLVTALSMAPKAGIAVHGGFSACYTRENTVFWFHLLVFVRIFREVRGYF
jgi:hypothetical protein